MGILMQGNGGNRPVSLGMGFAVAGVLAFTAQAQAVEIVEQSLAKDEQGAPASANWTGFYLSNQTGGEGLQFGQGQEETPLAPGADGGGVKLGAGGLGLMGVVGGAAGGGSSSGAGGYNWGQGAVVYGVEGEWSFGERGSHIAAIRGRLGLASDKWLFYGAAGAGIFGNGRITAPEVEAPGLQLNMGENRAGFVVGGGIEARLNARVKVGVEGLYYGLDAGGRDEKFGLSSAGAGTGALSDATIVRGRLTLRLGSESEPLK
jgi:outer membrane immunogenic protein